MCVYNNAITETVITVPLFMIFCCRQLQVMFPKMTEAWWQSRVSNYERNSRLCFLYIILADLDRCQGKNIAGVDLRVYPAEAQRQVSKQRGLKRLVTSWL